MKILVFLKSIDGGTGTFALHLLKLPRYFKGKSCKVQIVCLEKPAYRRIENHSVRPLHGFGTYPSRYGMSLLLMLRFLREIAAYRIVLKRERPDIVLSVDVHANLVSLMHRIIFFDKTPLVINNRICLSAVIKAKASNTVRRVLKRVVTTTYRYADGICAVSKGVKEDLREYFWVSQPIKVIGNGIAVAINQKPKTYNHPHRLLCISRLTPQKDFHTLIQAFALVRKIMPGSTLTIIGDGPEKNNIIDLISALRLTRSIKMRPWSNQPMSAYAKADIFVLASFWEGFPNVLLEAMSMGMPVVSTDAPSGPAEVLGGSKYGILTPVGDKERLAAALRQLLGKRSLYEHYADRSLERARYYRIEKMLDSYARYIGQILTTASK